MDHVYPPRADAQPNVRESSVRCSNRAAPPLTPLRIPPAGTHAHPRQMTGPEGTHPLADRRQGPGRGGRDRTDVVGPSIRRVCGIADAGITPIGSANMLECDFCGCYSEKPGKGWVAYRMMIAPRSRRRSLRSIAHRAPHLNSATGPTSPPSTSAFLKTSRALQLRPIGPSARAAATAGSRWRTRASISCRRYEEDRRVPAATY
jgi:hypothetical protein